MGLAGWQRSASRQHPLGISAMSLSCHAGPALQRPDPSGSPSHRGLGRGAEGSHFDKPPPPPPPLYPTEQATLSGMPWPMGHSGCWAPPMQSSFPCIAVTVQGGDAASSPSRQRAQRAGDAVRNAPGHGRAHGAGLPHAVGLPLHRELRQRPARRAWGRHGGLLGAALGAAAPKRVQGQPLAPWGAPLLGFPPPSQVGGWEQVLASCSCLCHCRGVLLDIILASGG